MRTRTDKDTFIKKATEKHGDKYDYSKVVLTNFLSYVIIGCPVHGDFTQRVCNHLTGKGCAECGKIKRDESRESAGLKRRGTTEEFISDAKAVHEDKYDYSKVNYVTSNDKIIITCKIHGDFEQDPMSHLSGRGCKQCYEPTRGASQKYSLEDFIRKSKEKHGDKYDYSKVVYINSQNKVIITCPIHGDFEQIPTHHIKGHGCQMCANQEITKNLRLTTEEFITRAKAIHGDRYDYSKSNYITTETKLTIICKRHGEFQQIPSSHISGRGCPRCRTSIGENKIRMFLILNKIPFEEQKKFPTCKLKRELPFDFYFPTIDTLLEYDGQQHFKDDETAEFKYRFKHDYKNIQKRDNIKSEWCKQNNRKLVRITFNDDIEGRLRDLFS